LANGKNGCRISTKKDGYTILQTNYTFQKQKLIFLPKENTLAVVEVKTRSSLVWIASRFC
jgi:Holliday junction resolvase-like predicted endonuclease